MRLPLHEFGQSLWSKFMRVIHGGTLRSSSLAARRPRRCNFEGNLTWATRASVSYGQMFTVKIVIVVPKASGSCSHEYSGTKMSYTHGRLILLFAGSCPAFHFVGGSFYLEGFPHTLSCYYDKNDFVLMSYNRQYRQSHEESRISSFSFSQVLFRMKTILYIYLTL